MKILVNKRARSSRFVNIGGLIISAIAVRMVLPKSRNRCKVVIDADGRPRAFLAKCSSDQALQILDAWLVRWERRETMLDRPYMPRKRRR